MEYVNFNKRNGILILTFRDSIYELIPKEKFRIKAEMAFDKKIKVLRETKNFRIYKKIWF